MLTRFSLVLFSLHFVAIGMADDKPVPPKEAASKFRLPPGFQATLFAGEPDVVQPIAFTFDDRGRLWVVECHTYPEWNSERNDRVLIFEDTDGDGQHDKRTVFLDNGKNLTGIEYGFGGIWLTAVPYLLFVPDADRDDKPDGPPVVKLDGWDLKAKHNIVNGLAWAPDGWLWGLNGILSNSSVGKPGTPEAERLKMNCGVWRYHPVTERVEAVAHGTTNPWGLDFDQYGEAFITNCVIKHAFHVAPGAHFERMFGQDVNPRTYRLIPSIADHIHWGGGHWTESRGGAGAHDAPGGGHAHSGCMIYLGANWPEQYRGRLYTCNIHGSRVNQDRLERHGSSYVAKHEPDVLLANDPWFRGLGVKYGPDGGVYVTDWSDTGECHDYDVADRTNGRIFKVTYGKVQPATKLGDPGEDPLFEIITSGTPGWYLQHALRIVHERYAAKNLSKGFADRLLEKYQTSGDEQVRLHCLWALSILNKIDESLRIKLLQDSSEHVVAWAIRTYDPRIEPERSFKLRMSFCIATQHKSAKVRLALADLALRDTVLAYAIGRRLSEQAANAKDPYLPYLIWYAIEANIDQFRESPSSQVRNQKIPLVRELFARRLTEPSEPQFERQLDSLLQAVAASEDPALRADVARGIFASLDGRRDLKAPAHWRDAYAVLSKHDDAAIRDIAIKLALTFRDESAITELLSFVADQNQPSDRRASAVAALAQGKAEALRPVLFSLLDDPALCTTALRFLPTFGDAGTPEKIFGKYSAFGDDARREAIATLTSRADWAKLLLDKAEKGGIPKRDFTAYHWQQLVLLKDPSIAARVEKLFGQVRPTKDDRTALIAEWKQKLSDEALTKADVAHGRAVFNKTCAACHKLFDAGGQIGPELTGAQRNNLDYVLSNVLDPSAVVPRDYQMQIIVTNDGRTLLGIVKSESDAVVTLQTATALLKIAKSDIEERTATNQSMMPEGLIQQFSLTDFRDLVAYLRSPQQVPNEKAD